MSVETTFHNWQTHLPEDDARYDRCSPNLLAIGRELSRRWGMTDLGCYAERDIRNGEKPSSHSHGAATDKRYGVGNRALAVGSIIPWLIDNSKELHLQAIHDYFGCRIWKAGRTPDIKFAHTAWWRTQTPNPATGMGQTWAVYFHLETTELGWNDARPIPDRVGVVVPQPDPTPVPPGGQSIVFTRTVKKGDEGPDVGFIQTVIRAPGSPNGNKAIVVDGKFGTQTEQAVKNMQAFTGRTADGIVGPSTQELFMQLANT